MTRPRETYHQGFELARMRQQMLREERAQDRLAAQAKAAVPWQRTWPAQVLRTLIFPAKLLRKLAGLVAASTFKPAVSANLPPTIG